MTNDILRTVGQVAGIGGISIGLILIIFREVIRKNIFPNLTKKQVFQLLIIIVVLSWTVAIAGIAAWTYTESSAKVPHHLSESLARQEAMLKEITSRFAMDSGPTGRQLSGEERYDRALDAVAQEHKIEKTALKGEIAAYVDWVRADSFAASDYQKALAEFAERHFKRAAELAESAADAYRGSFQEKTAEADKEKLFDSLILAGNAHLAEYRSDDAIRHLTEGLHLRDESSDPEEWAVAAMMLYGAMEAAGQYRAALPLLIRVVDIRERVLGEDHPGTLASVSNLGPLHSSMGE